MISIHLLNWVAPLLKGESRYMVIPEKDLGLLSSPPPFLISSRSFHQSISLNQRISSLMSTGESEIQLWRKYTSLFRNIRPYCCKSSIWIELQMLYLGYTKFPHGWQSQQTIPILAGAETQEGCTCNYCLCCSSFCYPGAVVHHHRTTQSSRLDPAICDSISLHRLHHFLFFFFLCIQYRWAKN